MLDTFNNKIIFLSKEYGNDIIPTLQALNYYDSKYEYSNLIKLQTKSNIDWFNECSDYLINNTIEYLEAKYINRCNCVSHPKYYIRIDGDKYCKDLYEKYNDNITNKYFVAGTIFYTNKNNIFNIINFMRANNYRSYFINNMYDNNAVNISNSPIHFLERLFGILTIVNSNLGINIICYNQNFGLGQTGTMLSKIFLNYNVKLNIIFIKPGGDYIKQNIEKIFREFNYNYKTTILDLMHNHFTLKI